MRTTIQTTSGAAWSIEPTLINGEPVVTLRGLGPAAPNGWPMRGTLDLSTLEATQIARALADAANAADAAAR